MYKEVEVLTKIINAKELLLNEMKTVFESEGLSSTEIMIIYMLQHKKSECRAGDLATSLYLPMSTMTGIIDKMIEKGIVIRKHGEEDRRVVMIMLNPEYIKKANNYMGELANTMKDILNNFTPEWLDDFNDKLRSFNRALEKRAQNDGIK